MYYRREKMVTYNSIINLQPLRENIQGVLDATKSEIEIPSFTFNPNRLDLDKIKVGDSVNCRYIQDDLFDINGVYRIIEININVSDEDIEVPTVTFDDFNIDDIISGQEENND